MYRFALSFFVTCALAIGVSAIHLPASCGHRVISAGHQTGDSAWRIIGGQIAKPGEWPWQVYLNKTIIYEREKIFSECGGAIISKDYIITAAHCVTEANLENEGIKFSMEVVLGTVDLNRKSSLEVRRKVAKVIRHEHFSYEKKQNDIALLKLDKSLDFAGAEKHLQPVCLLKLSEEFFENCFATGFGYQDVDMLNNDYKLRSVADVHQEHSKCNNQFLHYNQTVNLCIGGTLNKGTCKGDSGSPYVCHHKTENKWYQLGLVSYGLPCALENVPDVLTRVSYFYDWILQQNN